MTSPTSIKGILQRIEVALEKETIFGSLRCNLTKLMVRCKCPGGDRPFGRYRCMHSLQYRVVGVVCVDLANCFNPGRLQHPPRHPAE